jgi:mono/diheme cytochrome c family protein
MIPTRYKGTNMKSIIYLVTLLALCITEVPASTDWSKEATLPGNKKCKDIHGHYVCYRDGNRANIWNLSDNEWKESILNGGKHALYYPVTVSPLQLPKRSLETVFESKSNSPLRRFIFKIARRVSHFNSEADIYKWLGLNNYPQTAAEQGPNPIPFMGHIEQDPMGVTLRDGKITFSCATCHSADLFGTKVLGMTNRFPKANEIFVLGQKALRSTPRLVYKALLKPTAEEYAIFLKSKEAIKHVGLKMPLNLGLDTSLAQVGLSLAKRKKDEYASYDNRLARRPRYNELTKVPADSKPAVWWNLKYKTKWLSDGSIQSGNPIYTNFLWNEIGRGIDLKKLESWLMDNQKTIRDLTAYVFAAQAPRYNDYFPRKIDIAKAKRGQKLFLKTCSGCHGEYEKGWDNGAFAYVDQIATTKVWYHEKTPVIDVETDPYRREGMRYFYKDLNRLKISKTIGTVVAPQDGYVPPPLVGIWARWPYFHNNAAPTLYDVITPASERPKSYIAVPAQDKIADFDQEKNGYPAKDRVRAPYRTDRQYYFDATRRGMGNMGHTRMLLDDDGNPKFNHQNKLEIIEFLKTL